MGPTALPYLHFGPKIWIWEIQCLPQEPPETLAQVSFRKSSGACYRVARSVVVTACWVPLSGTHGVAVSAFWLKDLDLGNTVFANIPTYQFITWWHSDVTEYPLPVALWSPLVGAGGGGRLVQTSGSERESGAAWSAPCRVSCAAAKSESEFGRALESEPGQKSGLLVSCCGSVVLSWLRVGSGPGMLRGSVVAVLGWIGGCGFV